MESIDKYISHITDPNVISCIKILMKRDASLLRINDMFLSKMDEFYAAMVSHKDTIEGLNNKITELKERVDHLEEQLRVLDWKIDNPGGDYYD